MVKEAEAYSNCRARAGIDAGTLQEAMAALRDEDGLSAVEVLVVDQSSSRWLPVRSKEDNAVAHTMHARSNTIHLMVLLCLV